MSSSVNINSLANDCYVYSIHVYICELLSTIAVQAVLVDSGFIDAKNSLFSVAVKKAVLHWYEICKCTHTHTHTVPSSVANRYVELNPDPQFRSDRPEWCFIRYDHTYHPTRAFQLELQWMVSTITLFHQLVRRG